MFKNVIKFTKWGRDKSKDDVMLMLIQEGTELKMERYKDIRSKILLLSTYSQVKMMLSSNILYVYDAFLTGRKVVISFEKTSHS